MVQRDINSEYVNVKRTDWTAKMLISCSVDKLDCNKMGLFGPRTVYVLTAQRHLVYHSLSQAR